MTDKKWVYLFGEVNEAEQYVGGDWEGVRALLGGKGSGVADMTRIGVPVPPGFTVTTEACNAYYAAGKQFPQGMWDQELAAMRQEMDSVARALRRLTPEQREAIELRFFAGLSAKEAAVAMGRQEGTDRGLQFRAIAALRREMGIEPDSEEPVRASGATR